MEVSKIKNFIIILLLIVNAFFLAILIKDNLEERRVHASTIKSTVQVYKQTGITLPESIINGANSASWGVVELQRDTAAEKKRVESLIGDASASNLGGNILMYNGLNGQAVFRGTGEFEILFEGSAVPVESGPVQTAERVMEKLGIDYAKDYTTQSTEGETITVVMTAAWNGLPILDSQVTFTLTENRLILVVGTRTLDIYKTGALAEMPDRITVLIRFLEILKEGGHICTEIKAMEPAYELNSFPSGEAELQPLWRIVTDGGEFYVNGLTCEAETL